MEFKKKLKRRLFYGAFVCMALGAAMLAVQFWVEEKADFFSSFGFALIVVGAARLLQYRRITGSEESIRAREIAETDERNLAIAARAGRAAFVIYILLGCCGMIVLQLMQRQELAQLMSLSVCALLVIYWLSYLVIRKKM